MGDVCTLDNVTVLKSRELAALRKHLKSPVKVVIDFARHGRPAHVLTTLSMHPTIVSLEATGHDTDFDPGDIETCNVISGGFAELKRLSLTGVDTSEDMADALLSLSKLEEVRLDSLTLGSTLDPLVRFIRNAPAGSTLDLLHVSILGHFDTYVARQSLLMNLRMRECGLDDAHVEALVSVISGCTELVHLDLSHNLLGSRSVIALMTMVLQSKSLKVVDLRQNKFNFHDKENMEEVASAKIISILV